MGLVHAAPILVLVLSRLLFLISLGLAKASLSFEAERVSASSISLLRLPKSKAEAEKSDKPFTLPVEVHVGSLAIPELFISEAVAGRDQRLVVSGRGDATAESGNALLQAVA